MFRWLGVLVFSVFISSQGKAQLTTRIVRDSLFIPWELTYGPDNHVWFTQKNGYICRMSPYSRRIDTLMYEPQTFYTGACGMLGLALHPNFSLQPFVFAAYTYQQAGVKMRIVRYQYSDVSNTLTNPQTLLTVPLPSFTNPGGRLTVVADKLFITVGDGGVGNSAQNMGLQSGKVLRINLDGSVPSDNPMPNNPVWSWGFRNSIGLVYAKSTLYASEQGATEDELNIIARAGNYGWSSVEGYCDLPAETAFCTDSVVKTPIWRWKPLIGVTGLDFYADTNNMLAALKGSLIMTAQGDSVMYEIEMPQGSVDSITNIVPIFGGTYGRLQDLCVSHYGSIFVSTCNTTPASSPIDKILEVYDPAFLHVPEIIGNGSVIVYPNPAGDFVIVRLPESAKAYNSLSYCLLAADGRTVRQGILSQDKATITTVDLPIGLYQVIITDGMGMSMTGRLYKR